MKEIIVIIELIAIVALSILCCYYVWIVMTALMILSNKADDNYKNFLGKESHICQCGHLFLNHGYIRGKHWIFRKQCPKCRTIYDFITKTNTGNEIDHAAYVHAHMHGDTPTPSKTKKQNQTWKTISEIAT